MAKTPTGLKAFRAAQRQLSDIMKCLTCGKSTSVMNVAARGFKPERITPETHCACPGGPLDLLKRGHLNPLHVERGGQR